MIVGDCLMYIDESVKLGLIVDEIVGFENDKFTLEYKNQGLKAEFHDDVSILDEETIKGMSAILKERYPKDLQTNMWYPLRFYGSDGRPVSLRYVIDTVIDSDPNRWMGRTSRYIYSESDRQQIMRKCAEGVAQRLKKYAKNHKIQYKIFATGEAGFRYE